MVVTYTRALLLRALCGGPGGAGPRLWWGNLELSRDAPPPRPTADDDSCAESVMEDVRVLLALNEQVEELRLDNVDLAKKLERAERRLGVRSHPLDDGGVGVGRVGGVGVGGVDELA